MRTAASFTARLAAAEIWLAGVCTLAAMEGHTPEERRFIRDLLSRHITQPQTRGCVGLDVAIHFAEVHQQNTWVQHVLAGIAAIRVGAGSVLAARRDRVTANMTRLYAICAGHPTSPEVGGSLPLDAGGKPVRKAAAGKGRKKALHSNVYMAPQTDDGSYAHVPVQLGDDDEPGYF